MRKFDALRASILTLLRLPLPGLRGLYFHLNVCKII